MSNLTADQVMSIATRFIPSSQLIAFANAISEAESKTEPCWNPDCREGTVVHDTPDGIEEHPCNWCAA
ncbi:hypothetical protein F0160_22535 [Paraburkholderia sp. JPY303]|uniref:hypothetical protein n=1 Tax=Paraburkholderia atlantica TaxID=2654982 RepID=UPI00158FC81A|nr:hypothetical protein [Paraburkholderia atlantica]NUY33265.1 hypothetical protein [Paraburkholderia atlantica]